MGKKSIWIVALAAIVAITTFSAFTLGTTDTKNSIKEVDSQFFRMNWSGKAYKYYDAIASISLYSDGDFRIVDLQNDESFSGTYVIFGSPDDLSDIGSHCTISFNVRGGNEVTAEIYKIENQRFAMKLGDYLFRN